MINTLREDYTEQLIMTLHNLSRTYHNVLATAVNQPLFYEESTTSIPWLWRNTSGCSQSHQRQTHLKHGRPTPAPLRYAPCPAPPACCRSDSSRWPGVWKEGE